MMPFSVGGGRRTHDAWIDMICEWETNEKGKKVRKSVNCKHCKESVGKKIEYVKAHMKICSVKMASTVEDDEIQEVEPISRPSSSLSTASATSSTSATTQGTSSSSGTSGTKRKHSGGGINSFFVTTSEADRANLDDKCAKFFIANNLSFLAAESPEFRDFVESLRPGYVPPNSKKIGGQLLEKIDNEVKEAFKRDVMSDPNTPLLLNLDGWSSVTQPLTATSLQFKGKVKLLFTFRFK